MNKIEEILRLAETEMSTELQPLIEEARTELAALQALHDPMVCGHKARYAVTSDEGTSFCCMCELEAVEKENAELRKMLADE